MFSLNDVIITDPQLIQDAFCKFYLELFYCKMDKRRKINLGVTQTGPRIDQDQQSLLNPSFSSIAIKDALRSTPDGKAPGLDGFNSKFYKAY